MATHDEGRKSEKGKKQVEFEVIHALYVLAHGGQYWYSMYSTNPVASKQFGTITKNVP